MKAYLEVPGDEDGEVLGRWWLVGKDDVHHRFWTDAIFERRRLQRKMQVSTGANWDKIKVYDRYNDASSIELGTVHTFNTEAECWDFKNSFSRQDSEKPHPLFGNVYLRRENEDGTWIDERALAAGVEVTGIEAKGKVGVSISYRITFGRLETGFDDDAGTYDWLEDENGELILDEDECFIGTEEHET